MKLLNQVIEKNKISGYDIIAIVSGAGVIGWILSDFFGGMIVFLFTYGLLIIPTLLLYVFSFFETLISLTRNTQKTNKTRLVAHGIVFLAIITFNVYHSDLLRSKKVMAAILKDDLYHYRLVFRKNGIVENQVSGMLGFSQTYHGEYKIEDNLIIFSQKPYDNDFLPDTLLLHKEQGAIFIKKNESGAFSTEKEWLNHLEIE